jgi:hypothetical protein
MNQSGVRSFQIDFGTRLENYFSIQSKNDFSEHHPIEPRLFLEPKLGFRKKLMNQKSGGFGMGQQGREPPTNRRAHGKGRD